MGGCQKDQFGSCPQLSVKGKRILLTLSRAPADARPPRLLGSLAPESRTGPRAAAAPHLVAAPYERSLPRGEPA